MRVRGGWRHHGGESAAAQKVAAWRYLGETACVARWRLSGASWQQHMLKKPRVWRRSLAISSYPSSKAASSLSSASAQPYQPAVACWPAKNNSILTCSILFNIYQSTFLQQ